MIVHQQTLRTGHSPPATCVQRCARLWYHALTHKNQNLVHTVLPPNILYPPTTLPLYLPLIHEILHAYSILFNSTKMHPSSFCVPLRYGHSSPPARINSFNNSHPLCLALYPETRVNSLQLSSRYFRPSHLSRPLLHSVYTANDADSHLFVASQMAAQQAAVDKYHAEHSTTQYKTELFQTRIWLLVVSKPARNC